MTRVLGLLLLVGCAARPPLPVMADLERVRGVAAPEAPLAPQAFAEADQERASARAAYDAHDDIAASLYAERAMAAYERARIMGRTARATTDLAHATSELAQKADELHALEAAEQGAARDGLELEKRILVTQQLRAPALSGPADTQREAARAQAARALVMQARLLCGAARLVSPQVAGLDAASAQVDAMDHKLDQNPRPVPIDDAARVRTTCLSLLTQARRVAQAKTAPDVLLTELSAAGTAPTRDERGVVVTLRDAFQGAQVTPDAQTKLEALGRVAAAHADVAVQVVVHDATPQSLGDERAKAAAAVVVKGGAAAARVLGVMAGTRNPVVDPSDARARQRNTRLEVVFVTAS